MEEKKRRKEIREIETHASSHYGIVNTHNGWAYISAPEIFLHCSIFFLSIVSFWRSLNIRNVKTISFFLFFSFPRRNFTKSEFFFFFTLPSCCIFRNLFIKCDICPRGHSSLILLLLNPQPPLDDLTPSRTTSSLDFYRVWSLEICLDSRLLKDYSLRILL